MTTQKTFAVIKNGQVVNLAIAPSGWAPPDLTVVEVPDGARANIGDSADPATWLVLGVTAPSPVVAPISPRQIRQALTRAGLRASVEAAVAAGDQDLKDWYEFSTAFERLNPQVVAMGEALSVSPASLDDLWALGASL